MAYNTQLHSYSQSTHTYKHMHTYKYTHTHIYTHIHTHTYLFVVLAWIDLEDNTNTVTEQKLQLKVVHYTRITLSTFTQIYSIYT